MTLTAALNAVDIARLFLFVHEAQQLGQNRGTRVEAIQHWSNGQTGDSWCCEFATMVLDLLFQGKAPISRGGSCQDVYEQALSQGWVTETPYPGDLFLYVNLADHAHHIGFVTGTDPLTGIAGNTSADGRSSNGDGVYEHPITPVAMGKIVYVGYPRVGR